VGAATTFASAANYLSNVVLGRALGPEEFADAALVVSGLLLLGAMALGLQLTAARAVATGAGPIDLRRIRRRAAMAGTAVGLALIALSPLLAGVLNMGSSAPLAVLGIGVPVYFVMATSRGVVQARHQFGRLALSIGAEALARLGVTLACILAGLGATGASVALLVSFVVALLPCRTQVGEVQPVGPDAAAASRRSVAGATMLLLFGQVVISNGDLWVVAARVPDEAGAYAAVALIGRLVFIASWSVITVVFPSLVSEGASPSPRLLGRAAGVTAVFGGVLTLASAIFAGPLMTSMVGSGFAGGAGLLWPYALATTLFVVANLLAVADLAAGRVVVPGVMAAGGVVQTTVLLMGAAAGAAWVVWAQVMLMAALLVVSCVASVPGVSLLRRSMIRTRLVTVRALGPA
jgi:O-antigen/teichoic acid export membrane protein